MSRPPPECGIGMVGYAFMGVAHSQAWSNARRYFHPPLAPVLAAICGRDAARAGAVADRFGWASVETDWKQLLCRDDVGLIDVCTPGDSHAEIAIAALQAGKHVLCEKPLANSVAEAEAMARAAAQAQPSGAQSMVGFTYRRVPAIALARSLIADGVLGEIRHVRAAYLQDWLTDVDHPLVWRLQAEHAGTGALGDLGAHLIDLTQYLTGQHIIAVSARLDTFVTERPLTTTTGDRATSTRTAPRGQVTVDDAALWLARFDSGVAGSFEASRVAAGHKNSIRIEINGSRGSLAFDFESMNELSFYDATADSRTAGFRRIVVTEPDHPYVGNWWPPGHLLGYEHSFTHQAVDFLTDIASGQTATPSFADGLQVQRVLAAIEHSATDLQWHDIPG